MMSKIKVKPVLSKDEIIQQLLNRAQKECYLLDNELPTVPDNRKLKIGDELSIGNLEDAVVCYVSDDYRYVVVDYFRTDNNYGKPIRTAAIGCFDWHHVYLKSSIKNTEFTASDKPIKSYLSSPLTSLISKVLKFGIDFSPEYQRDYVWSMEDKERLIGSIFEGRDIGKFVFLKYNWDDNQEVLDGKQRLDAIIDFYTSKISYKGLYYHELSALDRHRFEDTIVQFAEIDAKKFTEADKIKLFLFVNASGVPQSEDHLKKLKDRLTELDV
jgi:hypothetical protein